LVQLNIPQFCFEKTIVDSDFSVFAEEVSLLQNAVNCQDYHRENRKCKIARSPKSFRLPEPARTCAAIRPYRGRWNQSDSL